MSLGGCWAAANRFVSLYLGPSGEKRVSRVCIRVSLKSCYIPVYVHPVSCACRCTECKNKFEFLPPGPLTAGASLRCPLCDKGRVVDLVSPNDLYHQLQHLRFLLSQDPGNSSTPSNGVYLPVVLDTSYAAVPLPLEGPLTSGPPPRQTPVLESVVKAAQGRSRDPYVGIKKGLVLKFPLVVAALRYLKGLKGGVVSLSPEGERRALMEVCQGPPPSPFLCYARRRAGV